MHLYFKAVIFQKLHWENHSTLMKFFFKQDPYRLILFVNNFMQTWNLSRREFWMRGEALCADDCRLEPQLFRSFQRKQTEN